MWQGLVRPGKVGLGKARNGMVVLSSNGSEWQASAWQGKRGHGEACQGRAGLGRARDGRVRLGPARLGWARHGWAWCGTARQGRAGHGLARLGAVGLGRVRLGERRRGAARLGTDEFGLTVRTRDGPLARQLENAEVASRGALGAPKRQPVGLRECLWGERSAGPPVRPRTGQLSGGRGSPSEPSGDILASLTKSWFR